MKMNENELETKKGLIIKAIKEMYNELGKIPTYNFYISNAKRFGANTNVRYFFKTWNNAVSNAGFKTKVINYTTEELKEIIINLANKLGTTPTKLNFEKDKDLPSAETIVAHFGTFNKGITTCELPINQHAIYTTEELKNAIIEFKEKEERLPTYSDFDGIKYKPHASVFAKRFNGKFATAVEELIGEKYIQKANKISNSEYIDGYKFDSSLEASVYRYFKYKTKDLNLIIKPHVYYRDIDNKINENYVTDLAIFDNNMNIVLIIEVAGLINKNQFNGSKTNDIEKVYLNTLNKKINLLKECEVPYIIVFKNYKKEIDKVINKLKKEESSIIVKRNITFNGKREYTNEQLFNNLYNICKVVGEIPTIYIFKKHSEIHPSIYTKVKKWNLWVLDIINQTEFNIPKKTLKSRKLLQYVKPQH